MNLFAELGQLFSDHALFLVGGSIRDRVMGREAHDFDFATDASPDEILAILSPWADAVWDVGREFGTIAARKDVTDIEITTFRKDGPGRKPEVEFTNSLDEDLCRRDFTINAMAMRVGPHGLGVNGRGELQDLQDPFGGLDDIQTGVINTPGMPEITFSDDPLRILRAARFVSQLDFDVARRVFKAMEFKGLMIKDISAERIAVEMDKLLMGKNPQRGLALLRDTGILAIILPELIHSAITVRGNDVETRWADLLADVALPDVQTRLRALKFSNDRVRIVTDLVALRLRFQDTVWFDPEVRKVLAAAGPQLERLLVLMDDNVLNERVMALLASEGHPEPVLDGKEVMDTLDLKPGPRVGEALQWLWNLRLEVGPMTKNEAEMALRNWASVTA